MVPDGLYDLCVPVLEDSATDEEERTEKVEELVKIQSCRTVYETFIQSSQPASPAAKTLRSLGGDAGRRQSSCSLCTPTDRKDERPGRHWRDPVSRDPVVHSFFQS